MPDVLEFFQIFLRDPIVAALLPTTAAAVRRICQAVNCARPQIVVELGPGNGVFTRYLLERLPAGSRVVAIERNATFAARLGRIADPRLTVVNDTAEHLEWILSVHGVTPVDVVLSGIPFSLMSEAARRSIIRQVAAALALRGCFIVYQFRSQVGVYLDEAFPVVRRARVWANLPPLVMFTARALRVDDHGHAR